MEILLNMGLIYLKYLNVSITKNILTYFEKGLLLKQQLRNQTFPNGQGYPDRELDF